MFKKIIGEKYFCGLDIGSQNIKLGLIHAQNNTVFELIGVYENKLHGFKGGAVSDLGELTECIHNACRNLTKKTGVKLKMVQLGVSGELVSSRKTDTVIPLIDRGSKVITGRDIRKVNHQARLLGIKMEEEILHDLPQYYSIDDTNTAVNPMGLFGRTLSTHTLMIYANVNRIKNISKAVHQAGLDIDHMYFSSFVSSRMVLDAQNIMQGCVLIDIGSAVTSVLIFKDGVLKFYNKIEAGGDHFTKAIAKDLSLPFDLSEEIKKSYAGVLSPDHHLEEEILVKRDSTYNPIKRELIYQAIEPEINLLVDNVEDVIKKSGLWEQVNGDITIIGGGALLPGLIERISQAMNAQAHLGKMKLDTKKPLGNSAVFSPVVGLARQGWERSLGYSFSTNGHSKWVKEFANRMRELYQEYF